MLGPQGRPPVLWRPLLLPVLTMTDAEKIVARLLRFQQRDLEKDDGHGIRSAREVAEALGMKTTLCRAILRELADAGRVRRLDCINGLFWQSTNPLPWEPGGMWPGQAERELNELKNRRAALLAEVATVDAEISRRETPKESAR